ncbi:MAG: M28 family metallopeptidase [Candidatus Neomarinimicrobiota bacterium]
MVRINYVSRSFSIVTLIFLLLRSALIAAPQTDMAAESADHDLISADYRTVADRSIAAALADSLAYDRLALICDTFGHRISGSENLENAIDWILGRMKKDGLENVHGETVMVPRWVRGAESLKLTSPFEDSIAILGLGGSIGTGSEGINAEVLVVNDSLELEARTDEAQGKIVVYNQAFESYGKTVKYRRNGAVAAAKAGAVASLIRSVGSFSLKTPHTGAMKYDPEVREIPHAAISSEDAMMLRRIQDRGERISLSLYMEARTENDVPSRNVVAEFRGYEKPEEIIVLGGHIDSWDVGQGAMDDAGGCVAVWEAVRLLKNLGLRPRRTIRVVLWTNEENGLRGGKGYRDQHLDELDDHILAIESDEGVFKPTGFGFKGSPEALKIIAEVGSLLVSINADKITDDGGGADISPLMKLGVPGMGLSVVRDKYFWYHHTDADTVDKLDPNELNECIAALAVMAYVVADLPQRLPRAVENQAGVDG